jgi:hypothetical protein
MRARARLSAQFAVLKRLLDGMEVRPGLPLVLQAVQSLRLSDQ